MIDWTHILCSNIREQADWLEALGRNEGTESGEAWIGLAGVVNYDYVYSDGFNVAVRLEVRRTLEDIRDNWNIEVNKAGRIVFVEWKDA